VQNILEPKQIEAYNHIRSGGAGFYEQNRGLIEVRGKEAVQFLDGMVTNDMKTLADGAQMLAAFPNAQGRLLAVVRILREGERFLIETEEATKEKLYENLFRFTFAGDFFVRNLTEDYRAVEMFGSETPTLAGGLFYTGPRSVLAFIPSDRVDYFRNGLKAAGAVEIAPALSEVLRMELGIPKFGVDMDETTIVPELGLDGMISYTKGCYVGQEIIARIHFRGHVAKRLTGLILEDDEPPVAGADLTSAEGKNAGRVTSVAYSPKLNKTIALAFVRYDYLAEGTLLTADGLPAHVKDLPIVS
jgi:folate-binding protein YgfZ